jgi:hypothetical protein
VILRTENVQVWLLLAQFQELPDLVEVDQDRFIAPDELRAGINRLQNQVEVELGVHGNRGQRSVGAVLFHGLADQIAEVVRHRHALPLGLADVGVTRDFGLDGRWGPPFEAELRRPAEHIRPHHAAGERSVRVMVDTASKHHVHADVSK